MRNTTEIDARVDLEARDDEGVFPSPGSYYITVNNLIVTDVLYVEIDAKWKATICSAESNACFRGLVRQRKYDVYFIYFGSGMFSIELPSFDDGVVGSFYYDLGLDNLPTGSELPLGGIGGLAFLYTIA